MPFISVPVLAETAEEARDLVARTARYRHRRCESHDRYGTVGSEYIDPIVVVLALTLILAPFLVLTRTLAPTRTLTHHGHPHSRVAPTTVATTTAGAFLAPLTPQAQAFRMHVPTLAVALHSHWH